MRGGRLYDIRDSNSALHTLEELTGVERSIWKNGPQHQAEFEYDEKLVESIIESHGHFPDDYETWTFVFSHITTSAEDCESIRKEGILDLKRAYSCPDSELRRFLTEKGVLISLSEHALSYQKKLYDISYGRCPPASSGKAYARWSIGRKFFYDFTVCGFLSVKDYNAYLGYVHRRPEILSNIDDLLGLNLSREWELNHSPYEIVAEISGTDILCENDTLCPKDKTLNYLLKAYHGAVNPPSEEIILLKNDIQVPPEQIKIINPLTC